MAYGFQQFYKSFGEYLEQLHDNVMANAKAEENGFIDYDEDEIIALTAENLRGPMILFLCLLAVSFIILLIENIVFKLKERRFLRDFFYHP